MKFNEKIKEIRSNHGLTQEQFANQLNVTRQAVSNWENDRNLPDLEMIITIAEIFELSLDELILGGSSMHNDITEKLIKDGSETRKAKLNLTSTIIGAFLLFIGLGCLFIKMNSVEYIDQTGILHENFFLLPIGFLFLFAGGVVFFVTGFKFLKDQFVK